MKNILIAGIILICLCHYAAADEVFVRDGTRYTGIVAEEDDMSLMLQTPEGTLILNKSDIVHVERSSEAEREQMREESKKSFSEETVAFIQEGPKNVKRYLLTCHRNIFLFLEKNRIYQFVAFQPIVRQFKNKSYRYYYFAVYMVLLIIVTLICSGIKNCVMVIVRKIFRIKQRYDI